MLFLRCSYNKFLVSSLNYKPMFFFLRKLITSFFLLVSYLVQAQDDIGALEVIALTKKDGKSLEGVNVVISKDSKKFQELKSGKGGKVNVELEYNHQYRIDFSYGTTKPVYFLIDANIPKKDEVIFAKYQVDVVLFDTTDQNIDLSKFKYPFTKIAFDPKAKNFTDDTKYLEKFKLGLFPEDKKAEATPSNNSKPKKESPKIIGGKIIYGEKSKPLANSTVGLYTDKGEKIESVKTNNFGNFYFKKLPPNEDFVIKLEETSLDLTNARVRIVNKKGKEIVATVANLNGEFDFRFLNSDLAALSEMKVEDVLLKIAGNLVTGEKSTPVSNVSISLINEKGEVIQKAKTNGLGGFVFTKLPPDQNFTIKIDEENTKLSPNSHVYMVTKSGSQVMVASIDGKGKFIFSFLSSDKNSLSKIEIDDTDLRTDLSGRFASGESGKTPLSNAKVFLVNSKGQVVQSLVTDKDGRFKFVNLPADENFILQLDENDTQLASYGKFYLTDEAGKVVKVIVADKNGKFTYEVLTSDENQLTSMYVDDPWITLLNTKSKGEKKEVVISENIYFNVNDIKILSEAEIVLNKVCEIMKMNPSIKIEVSSHTDSQGSDEYNMNLSKKRAKSAVDFMTGRGVEVARLTGIGYGESRLINECGNGIKCAEEDHAKNRRIDFKVMTQ